MTKISTQPYKGTRDFYPTDMAVRSWMFDRLRRALKSHGYQEYDGPMLEPFELYAAKSSEEIVNEQLYWLIDRGERKLAVRPEMTPTLARMVAAQQNELPKPIRWFSIPNLWRYERPQRGRLREHWQLNVDVFGGDPLAEDLEILLIVTSIMNAFGATSGYEVRLNHRGLSNFFFKSVLKLADAQVAPVGRLLDAAAKMTPDVFEKNLTETGLSHDQIAKVKSVLQTNGADWLRAQAKGEPSLTHLDGLLARLDSMGLKSFFRFDPSVMRGFLYYTGMVLEVYDLHPDNNRALFGGGRYDDLVGMFGGSPLPGVGFGMGDVTLRNFLETHKLIPNLNEPKGVYLAYLEDNHFGETQALATTLRQRVGDLPVFAGLRAEKPRKAFETADKLRAKYIIFVGDNEIKSQRFTAKNLQTKDQFEGAVQDLSNFILKD